SVAVGIMIVVATFAAWTMIDSLGVFASVDQLLREVLGQEAAANLNIMQYFEFDRFLSAATLIAVVDVVLLTALATIGAFLYNITAALVGGLHLTLTDELGDHRELAARRAREVVSSGAGRDAAGATGL